MEKERENSEDVLKIELNDWKNKYEDIREKMRNLEEENKSNREVGFNYNNKTVFLMSSHSDIGALTKRAPGVPLVQRAPGVPLPQRAPGVPLVQSLPLVQRAPGVPPKEFLVHHWPKELLVYHWSKDNIYIII